MLMADGLTRVVVGMCDYRAAIERLLLRDHV